MAGAFFAVVVQVTKCPQYDLFRCLERLMNRIDANVDQERDFLQQSFAGAGVLAGSAYVTPENPLTTAKTATGGSFQSDGRIVVMDLK